MGPKPSDGPPYKEKEIWTGTEGGTEDTQTWGRRLCDNGGRAWRGAAASQKTPRMAGSRRQAGRGREGSFPRGPADTRSQTSSLQK